MTETEKQKDIYILGIESSCDETAASVVKNGREVLSNVISSQIALHTLYGGVVPEIASRRHCEFISATVKKALLDAGKTIDDVEKACWDVGVAVQDGKMFHGPCHLRMNLASPRSRIEEAFRRMDQYVFHA